MPRSPASADVQGWIPALADLAEHIGDAQVRNRGTIGGSIANNDPAADYPAAIVGLNATVHTNKRTIAADDFFTGMFDTALNDGEIITEVRFPKPDKAGYAKFPNPASRYAIVGVMVAQTGGGVRVAVTGAGPCVFRLPDFESALARNFSADAHQGPERQPERPQQRHPCQRRVPGASGRRDGAARGRGGALSERRRACGTGEPHGSPFSCEPATGCRDPRWLAQDAARLTTHRSARSSRCSR